MRTQRSEAAREAWLLKSYRLTLDDYEAMLVGQGGKCALCGTRNPEGKWGEFCVDHDHSCCSGIKSCGDCIRGLLCGACNRRLGHYESLIEDTVFTNAADAYMAGER